MLIVIHIPHHEKVKQRAEEQETKPDYTAAWDAKGGDSKHARSNKEQAGCDHPVLNFFIHLYLVQEKMRSEASKSRMTRVNSLAPSKRSRLFSEDGKDKVPCTWWPPRPPVQSRPFTDNPVSVESVANVARS